MTIEYEDVVRSLTHAYWTTLLEKDAEARAIAAEKAQLMGFTPEAANTMINTFSRKPLEEWLAHQSGV
ncbi:MAG: hypothetical protein DI628_08725 [Blastochloris viridis]|uniref:Uncharacterized protein n=1 Tax=Blastochloris viridis TaxID=1079 RepID=A0A6N4RA97_BLAVI|nr:MAG: hypothetical protein DI628_08725 [Blastochloris viridis]